MPILIIAPLYSGDLLPLHIPNISAGFYRLKWDFTAFHCSALQPDSAGWVHQICSRPSEQNELNSSPAGWVMCLPAPVPGVCGIGQERRKVKTLCFSSPASQVVLCKGENPCEAPQAGRTLGLQLPGCCLLWEWGRKSGLNKWNRTQKLKTGECPIFVCLLHQYK